MTKDPSLTIKDFTVFRDIRFEFSTHLNVVVGANGTGKTHLLKLVYAILKQVARPVTSADVGTPTKAGFERDFASRIQDLFLPDELGRLVSRSSKDKRCELTSRLFGDSPLRITFGTKSSKEVNAESVPESWREEQPIYFPTQELLTIAPTFPSLYWKYRMPFSLAYAETCDLLNGPVLRNRELVDLTALLEPIEAVLGGKLVSDHAGRFYVESEHSRTEIQLVAEGHRKLAMLARLIANGCIQRGSTILWDEPEANLNPQIIKVLVSVLLELAKSGVQIYLATHSLFMLREIEIQLGREHLAEIKPRYFGLQSGHDSVTIEQSNSVDQIGKIVSLQEELSQSDRYIESEND